MCRPFGIKVAYLPPYSPDLNPIEEAFAQLKAWIRKYRKLAETMEMDDFIHLRLSSLTHNAAGHFVRSRLPMQQDSDEMRLIRGDIKVY
jgi:transposase